MEEEQSQLDIIEKDVNKIKQFLVVIVVLLFFTGILASILVAKK